MPAPGGDAVLPAPCIVSIIGELFKGTVLHQLRIDTAIHRMIDVLEE